MLITKPVASDLHSVLALCNKQFDYHYNLDSTYYISANTSKIPVFEDYILEAINSDTPRIFIAKDGDVVVGFVTFDTSVSDYIDSNITKYGEIVEIFVDEAYRNSGVGKLLMSAVEAIFKDKKLEYIKLQVSTFNEHAIEVYKHLKYVNRQTLMFKKL